MKSLHKASPNTSLDAWNPPDLESETSSRAQIINTEKVLAIFDNEDGGRNPKNKIEKSALHRDGIGKSVKAWQPGQLKDQPESMQKEEWSFIEITDTPFDKSWKVKAPNNSFDAASKQEITALESEGTKILDTARHQAEEILLAAQAQADDVLLSAQSEIDEQNKEGYRRGHDEARAEIEETITAVKKMVEEVENWKNDLLSQSEEILIQMMKDISAKMFGEGVELDVHALQANLNRIMENAHGLGALKIFIHPRDARLLDSYWAEQQMLVLGEQVKIIPSSNIKPGGCLVKGNMGTVDGRVETQLDAILKTFDGQNPSAE